MHPSPTSVQRCGAVTSAAASGRRKSPRPPAAGSVDPGLGPAATAALTGAVLTGAFEEVMGLTGAFEEVMHMA